jgi:hypothetical protein
VSVRACFYCRGARSDRLIVAVYVDDLIINGSSIRCIKEFKNRMAKVFMMSDLGMLTYYLGIDVRQEKDEMFLSQICYARKILEKGGMKAYNPCQVPMQTRLKLKKGDGDSAVDATEYRSLVGSLRYLTHTRPDNICCGLLWRSHMRSTWLL